MLYFSFNNPIIACFSKFPVTIQIRITQQYISYCKTRFYRIFKYYWRTLPHILDCLTFDILVLIKTEPKVVYFFILITIFNKSILSIHIFIVKSILNILNIKFFLHPFYLSSLKQYIQDSFLYKYHKHLKYDVLCEWRGYI